MSAGRRDTVAAVDLMVVGAHPDDAEICCGGVVLRAVAAGRRVAIVDMTRGEKGTRGSPETRAAEAAAASAALGIHERVCLGLPDTGVRDDDDALAALVGALRRLRPRLLLAPAPHDVHPDHVATGLVARRAFFHAGLRHVLPELGAPHRPRRLLQFPSHVHVEPSLCIDISDQLAAKQAAIRCYASQLGGDRSHLVHAQDILQRIETRDRWAGMQIGVIAAEPYLVDGPVPVGDLFDLIGPNGDDH